MTSDKEISRSLQRHSFQKEKYIERKEQGGEEPDPDYLDLFDSIMEKERIKFNDPASRENNLEYDLLTTDWILEKARTSEIYAQNLYAALCNNDFQKKEVWNILADIKWSCSWRYAGGIIADMRQEGDYIDWYCSGIQHDYDTELDKFVSESHVTDEIETDLDRLGWIVCQQMDK